MKSKKVVVYLFNQPLLLSLLEINEKLSEHPFKDIGGSDYSGSGFVAPFPEKVGEEKQPLLGVLDGRWFVKVREDRRSVKAAAVTRLLNEKVNIIERTESRKVYRKEHLVLKDEIVVELLPNQIPETTYYHACISPASGLLFIEASSYSNAEKMLNHLRRALASLPVSIINPNRSFHSVISPLLVTGESIPDFGLGQNAKFSDMEKKSPSLISIKEGDPQSAMAVSYLNEGYQCIELELESAKPDGVSVYFTEKLQLKNIKYSDQFVAQKIEENSEADFCSRLEYEADTILRMSALEIVWQRLINILGGYHKAPAKW